MKTCRTCKVEKNLAEFYTLKTKCKTCYSITSKKWIDNNKEKKKQLNTDWYYRDKYGISYASFFASSSTQEHKCKICNIDLEFKVKNRKSAVQDHDHLTGKLRGVLCNSCNVGLGFFKDDKQIILNALNYLKEYEN